MRSVRNKLPKRSSKFGVGKEIGGAVYLHRKYEGKLGNLLNAAKSTLPDDFDYQIVKYNYQTTPGASLFNRPSACVSQRRSQVLMPALMLLSECRKWFLFRRTSNTAKQ
jgi:hypothetical protein